MKIGFANDHAGTELKFFLMKYYEDKGHTIINYGTDSTDSYDYPVAAKDLCDGINKKEVELGIAICGTGIGISIACNKIHGIRACTTILPEIAKLSREHNNANVLCLGARFITFENAINLIDTFISTPFSEGERHIKRIGLIKNLEK